MPLSDRCASASAAAPPESSPYYGAAPPPPGAVPYRDAGPRLPLQSPIGIRGFRDLVVLDPLMMMWVLRLAQDRISTV